MSKSRVKNYWAEIYDRQKSKIVYFDSEEQGREYLQKVGKPNTTIHDINVELPF